VSTTSRNSVYYDEPLFLTAGVNQVAGNPIAGVDRQHQISRGPLVAQAVLELSPRERLGLAPLGLQDFVQATRP
jgi:hypothetical protein